MDDFVAPLVQEVIQMPESWDSAISAVTSGITSVVGVVTGSVLLMAMSFGFRFVKKAISVVRRLIHIG